MIWMLSRQTLLALLSLLVFFSLIIIYAQESKDSIVLIKDNQTNEIKQYYLVDSTDYYYVVTRAFSCADSSTAACKNINTVDWYGEKKYLSKYRYTIVPGR